MTESDPTRTSGGRDSDRTNGHAFRSRVRAMGQAHTLLRRNEPYRAI